MTTETSDRYRRVAGQFTQRVRQVPADAWQNPSPCEGEVARDVVGHLVDWLPGFFFGRWDLTPPLDPDEVHRFVSGMEPLDEMLRAGGQYGPRVPVPHDADEQTRLIGFLGRQP